MKSICVYCGSSSRAGEVYFEAARELGRVLAHEHLRLVYGGARVGLMGALADAAMDAGGDVVGIIPRALVEKEVAHEELTERHVVESMHERKALMHELSDAFIALPGGFGTLDELFETLTWAQIGFHRKPTGLLNIGGYFDQLLAFCDHAVEEGFVHAAHREMIYVENSAQALLGHFRTHVVPEVGKWWTPR
jgi:uncharacterized protein (TIGR00730 family)